MAIILAPIQIGMDLGKINDPVAISVAEVVRVDTGRFRPCKRVPAHIDKSGKFVPAKDAEPVFVTRYIIRQIKRLPLGTSYPDVAMIFVDLLCNDRFENRRTRALIDSTGVGKAVFDIIEAELAQRINETQGELQERLKNVSLQPCNFVHGEKYNRRTGSLGKAYLVSRLQALLQNGRVDAPKTKEVEAMLEELRTYEIKINDKGTDQYGAFKTGTKDDMATALALSVLEDVYALQIRQSERVH